MKRELTKTDKDLIYLMACALNQSMPDKSRIVDMDLQGLYSYAKFLGLSALTYDALEMTDDNSADVQSGTLQAERKEILIRWKELRDKALRKNLLLDNERQKLFSYMDKEGIWYMPLKGVVLKEMYPKQEMRQMADNDILFDAKYEEMVKDYFINNGYEVILYKEGNHDVYEKKPVYNFEMHTALFDSVGHEEWANYYENVEQRLRKDITSCRVAFTEEDFYIYFLTHTYKHFSGSGAGLRALADGYIYLKQSRLNWNYVEEELDKLGIITFEKVFRGLLMKLFEGQESTEKLVNEELDMLCECLDSGTYGTQVSRIEKQLQKIQGDRGDIQKHTKIKYLISRLVLPMSYYRNNHPLIYKTKVLLPFFILFRIVRGVLFASKRIISEIKIVKNT